MAEDGLKRNLPLLRAVKDGKLEGKDGILELLEKEAVDVNFQNHYGDTTLILSAWYGHTAIAKQLLASKADVDATNCDGNSALNCAAYHGFFEVAELLIKHHATIDVPDNVTGKTALIKAAYVGHAEVASLLLEAGADKDAMDNQGYTGLAFATSFNHTEVILTLLGAKASPNVQDEFGITPLIHSAARGHADAVDMLLRAVAKPSLEDLEGKSALDYAASAGFDDVVSVLSATDVTPSVCTTSRELLNGGGTYRGNPGTSRGGAAVGAKGSLPALSARGDLTTRMTPRVPKSGDLKQPKARADEDGGGTSRTQGDHNGRAGLNGRSRAVHGHIFRPEEMQPVAADSIVYLTKKLVSLSFLLEQVAIGSCNRPARRAARVLRRHRGRRHRRHHHHHDVFSNQMRLARHRGQHDQRWPLPSQDHTTVYPHFLLGQDTILEDTKYPSFY